MERKWQPRLLVLPVLSLLLIATAVVCLGVGAVPIPLRDIVQIFFYQTGLAHSIDTPAYQISVLTNIRLPRIVLGILVGACLGICGASLQGLFRNPLAEPALVGVSSGAALAAVAMTYFGWILSSMFGDAVLLYGMPVAAFFGGTFTTFLVYILATREHRTDMSTMILAGIAVNAVASAGIGIFVFMGDDQQVRAILFWIFGSLGGALWNTLLPSVPFLLLSIVAITYYGYALNLYLLGEREAKHLGIQVQRMKWLIIVFAAMGAGTSVALSGMIGFVGLVVPHLLRLGIGPDNRLLLPSSALLGGILLLLADLLARTVVAPTELPIGLVTSLVGSPFFLYLLMRNRRKVGF